MADITSLQIAVISGISGTIAGVIVGYVNYRVKYRFEQKKHRHELKEKISVSMQNYKHRLSEVQYYWYSYSNKKIETLDEYNRSQIEANKSLSEFYSLTHLYFQTQEDLEFFGNCINLLVENVEEFRNSGDGVKNSENISREEYDKVFEFTNVQIGRMIRKLRDVELNI